jgi:hypothetical protein
VLCVVVVGGATTGVVAVVVSVSGGVDVVVVLVVDGEGASGAGVVEVPEVGVGGAGGSAASAPPDSGPPKPAAVSPPPASAERITRRAAVRALFTPDIPAPCSLWPRPVVVLEQGVQTPRTPPDRIHIGREARVGKGFVIGAAIWAPDRRKHAHRSHHSGRATALYRCPRRTP